jgi:hypothetical protein
VLIIDHKTKLPRVGSLKELLTEWQPASAEQVYGSSELDKPGEITEKRRVKIRNIISGQDLVLLHAGDNQHLVEAVLIDEVFKETPCLVYSGGTFPSGIASILSESRAEIHAQLPITLEETIGASWLASTDAANLRDCIKKIHAGATPRDAVEAVFGDHKLEAILNSLFDELKDLKGDIDPEALKALRIRRDALFDGYYKQKRGW